MVTPQQNHKTVQNQNFHREAADNIVRKACEGVACAAQALEHEAKKVNYCMGIDFIAISVVSDVFNCLILQHQI